MPGQPYNDGLSDFERYWCLQQENQPRPGDIPHHGGATGLNITSVTCWH